MKNRISALNCVINSRHSYSNLDTLDVTLARALVEY